MLVRQETKMLAMSTRRHAFGRQMADEVAAGGWFSGRGHEEEDGAHEPSSSSSVSVVAT